MSELLSFRTVGADSPDLPLLESVNEEALPENERVALSDLLASGIDGNLELTGIYLKDEPVGFCAARNYKGILYLAFLAVRADLRGKGIGSAALKKIIGSHPKQKVIVEFEALRDGTDENDLRVRRKRFYLRNGFYETFCCSAYHETEFEIGCSDPLFDLAEYGEFLDWLATVIEDPVPKPHLKQH